MTVNRDPEQYRCTSIAEDIESLNNLLNWWTEVPYDHYTEWLSETYDMLKSADGQSKLPAVIETERLILRQWEEAVFLPEALHNGLWQDGRYTPALRTAAGSYGTCSLRRRYTPSY